MNSSGDEGDDRFFESLDRIPSTSESETEEESGEFGQKSVGNGNGRAFIRPPDYSKYEIWKGEPGSVQERRERLLRELGLRNGGDPRPDSNANLRRVQFAEIRPASATVDVSRSVSGEEFTGRREESWSEGTNLAMIETDSNSADGRINFDGKENNLANSTGIGADEQWKSSLYLSSGDFSREVEERRAGVISSADNSSGELIVKIKNLDNGKEFVVNELGENGMWNKLKELDTGRQLSLEEFDRVVGHSPLVQELMKRENGEFSGRESPDLRGGGKGKKKAGWLRTIKDVAQTMRAVNKDKKSSDERDTSSEKGGRRSSSATDDSQEILLHMPKKTKVWHYGKSDKEFSGLFTGQEIQAHQGSIWVLRFSSDGRYLASGGQDRIVHVWQVIESKQKQDTPAQKSDDNASNTYVTANGSTELVPLNIDSAVDKKKKGLFLSGRKSSATSTDCICLPEIMFLLSEKPLCSFHGHLDDVLDLSWSQSQYLLSSSMDKTVRLWHMSYKSCLRVFSHNDYVTCIQFNPIDDRFFISGSLDKKVRIWSIPDRKVVDWTDIYEMVTAACYTPDGQGALVGTHKGNCLSYTTSGNRLQEEKQIEVQKKKKKSRGKKITGFQFAPGNHRKVLITSADSRIRIFDGAELVQTFKGFRNTTSQICASFTTNGKYIVSASEDSYVYIWKDDIPSNPAAKNQGSCRSYEYFVSRKVSTAIPWHGMKCESLASSPREIISVEGPELLLQGSGNAGRKSTSFLQGSTSQGHDVTLYNPSRSQISGNSEIQMVERNGGILEGAKFRDRSEGSSRETMNQDVFLTCNNRLSAAGSLRPSLTAFPDSQRVVDQSSPNHGLFLDSMSKGSATWPEEKLPAFTIQNLNLAASESSNSNSESRDGSSIQDQSIHASCGSVIVSASLSGELRTFQNYGCPVHL